MIVLTHFDENYLAQGLTMIRSLFQHASEPIKLVVLWLGKRDAAPDDKRIEVVHLNQFMNGLHSAELFAAREKLTWKEFCWLLEPALVDSALTRAEQEGEEREIFYVDSDCFFYADPMLILRSLPASACVGLTKHHFPAGKESMEKKVGVFNFGCGYFRACPASRSIVRRWLERTLESCDGDRAGHQPYLDEWPEKLGEGFVELPRSLNCAPWQALEWRTGTGESSIKDVPFAIVDGKQIDMVMYHYHETRRTDGPGIGRNPVKIKDQYWNLTNYHLPTSTIESVYIPYLAALAKFL